MAIYRYIHIYDVEIANSPGNSVCTVKCPQFLILSYVTVRPDPLFLHV